jgi:hypothetical protein
MQAVRAASTRYSWVEVDDPVYVVDLHASAGLPAERWRLVDAGEVGVVVAGAPRAPRGRPAAVSLEVEDAGGHALVQLTPAAGLRRVSGW